MELRHLRYFIAVAEEGQISRAAERLGMQQPPLSQQIKVIEQALDVRLFHRKARGVELTEAGRTFLDEARATLAQADRAIEATQRTARGEQGRICIGVTATAPFHPFVPRVIRAFRESFPGVSLTLQECLSGELVERLRGERMDVAFLRTSVGDTERLAAIHLLEEPMVAASPSRQARVTGNGRDHTAVSLKDLAGETFIVFGRPHGTAMYDATIAACRAAGFRPQVGQEADRVASALNLVAAGLGICLVPASLQRMHLDGIVYRRLSGPSQPKVPLNLALRRGETSPVVRQFVNLVKRTARQQVATSGRHQSG
jgi:DNA-binding transcriptional LysR family regulator